jgi:hypothetical protein
MGVTSGFEMDSSKHMISISQVAAGHGLDLRNRLGFVPVTTFQLDPLARAIPHRHASSTCDQNAVSGSYLRLLFEALPDLAYISLELITGTNGNVDIIIHEQATNIK